MKQVSYDTDPGLIEGFRLGDQRAFTLVYKRFYERVFWYGRKYILEAVEVEDITAETFIQLWKHRSEFTNLDGISAFLHTTVRNKCYDLLRHKQMKAGHQAELLSLLEENEPGEFFIEQLRAELMRKIYAEVDKLPAKMKEVFLLSYQEGLKPAQIAERLNINVQTVSNQKVNAIKMLKLILAHQPLLLAFLILLEQEGVFHS